MARKNYTPAERALHVIGALAGKTLREINEAIAYGDDVKRVPPHRIKELPAESLQKLIWTQGAAFTRFGHPAVRRRERRLPAEDWEVLWDHCVAPKKVGDL